MHDLNLTKITLSFMFMFRKESHISLGVTTDTQELSKICFAGMLYQDRLQVLYM